MLHDLGQPPTAEQVSQGGLAPYVDGVYASAAFAANPVADFTDGDTSDGITPVLTDRRLYGAGIDSLLAREDAAGVVDFALRDLIGSVRAWVEADGTIAARHDFDSYGIPSKPADFSGGRRFGFTGAGAAGVDSRWSMRARDQDHNTGRFLSADPLGLLSRASTHQYAKNRPVGYVDRTGLSEMPARQGGKDGPSVWPALTFDQFVNLVWDKLGPDPGFFIGGGKEATEGRLEAMQGLYARYMKYWQESLLFRGLSSKAYSAGLFWEFFGAWPHDAPELERMLAAAEEYGYRETLWKLYLYALRLGRMYLRWESIFLWGPFSCFDKNDQGMSGACGELAEALYEYATTQLGLSTADSPADVYVGLGTRKRPWFVVFGYEVGPRHNFVTVNIGGKVFYFDNKWIDWHGHMFTREQLEAWEGRKR